MSNRMAITGGNANLPKEQTGRKLRQRRQMLRSDSAMLEKFRKNNPVKTAVYLSELTGAPIRTCERWLSTERLPSDAVWALLRTENGIEYLIAGMSEVRPVPRWFGWLFRASVTANAERRRRADLKLIEQTLEADRDLTQAIARATAVSVQDEEFHRPFIDALSSFLGAPDSALAQRKR